MNGPVNGKLPGLGGPSILQQAAMQRHGARMQEIVGGHMQEFVAAYGPIPVNPPLMLVAIALADRCDALEARLKDTEGFIADMREAAAEYASKGDAS